MSRYFRSPSAPTARTAVLLAAALASTLVLAGCTSGSGSSDSAIPSSAEFATDPGRSSAEFAPELSDPSMSDMGAADASVSESAFAGDSAATAADADRQVISTGWATITADDPIAAAADAEQIVESAGGRVDARSEQAPVDGALGQVTLTLRIPSSTFTETLDELKELGRDISVETSANDVTTQTQDLDARIAVLTTSVDRLLGLLASAATTSELIEVETALSARQGELDSLQTQRRYLSDQVTMATLTLTLVSEAEAPAQTPDTFWDSLVAGLAAFAGFFTAAFLALGYAVPWLLLFGLLILAFLIVRRRRTRARVGADLDSSTNARVDAAEESDLRSGADTGADDDADGAAVEPGATKTTE